MDTVTKDSNEVTAYMECQTDCEHFYIYIWFRLNSTRSRNQQAYQTRRFFKNELNYELILFRRRAVYCCRIDTIEFMVNTELNSVLNGY